MTRPDRERRGEDEDGDEDGPEDEGDIVYVSNYVGKTQVRPRTKLDRHVCREFAVGGEVQTAMPRRRLWADGDGRHD